MIFPQILPCSNKGIQVLPCGCYRAFSTTGQYDCTMYTLWKAFVLKVESGTAPDKSMFTCPLCSNFHKLQIVSVLHQDEGGIGKSIPAAQFPETQEISRGRSPREISRVEGNLEGGGDGFPNSSRVLVEYGHSPHHQSYP